MKFWSVVLVFAVLIAAVLLNSWRISRSFAALLEKEGFKPSPCGSTRIELREKELQKMTCWRGPLTKSVTGEIVTGCIPSLGNKSDYLYFLRFVVAPSATIDDAWLRGWSDQDTFRTPDGKFAVMWNLMDKPENLERVLAAIRARLPS
jgi:hypothetical protein